MSGESQGGGHNVTFGAWVATFVIIAGFIVGGIALIYWNWVMFWIGAGLIVVGSLGGWAAGIMDQVTEYGDSSGHGTGGDPEKTVPSV